MIEAFFIGSGRDQVFATYHPPADGSGRALTVICPPLFSEYMRTQLALRQVAISLAEQGQHVLRFDYRGTGDSYGDLADMSTADWLADILMVIREARDLTGSSAVRLLGVRAGALLACQAAGASADVQRIVLWDPVSDGASYLRLLRRLQAALLERNLYLDRADRREASQECAGYILSKRMLEDLQQLEASTYERVPKSLLHVVETSSAATIPVQGIVRHATPFPCNWDRVADELLIPRPVLERLIACLTQT